MSSNNLYNQLIDVFLPIKKIAKQEQITISQTQSARSSARHPEPILDDFTIKINQVKQKIQQINENNKQILSFREKLSSNTVPAKQAQLHKHLQNLCDSNYEQICVLKNDLQFIGRLAKNAIQTNPNEPETNSKIYYRQYLTKEVEKIVRESNKINKLIQKYSINTSLKRIKALAPQMSEEQAMTIAQKKNGFDQLVMAKTMGKASLKLKYRVDDILQKHQGILQLEKSVQQNARLMNQVSFLVRQQGEMIDSVFDNILEAKDYVEKAEQNLAKEKKNVKKSRKKMCCIIFVGIIVLALVLTPIIIKATKTQ